MAIADFYEFKLMLGTIPSISFTRVPAQIRCQEMKFWCWAAVTQLLMVLHGRIARQCRVAQRHFLKKLGKGSCLKCCSLDYKESRYCNKIESLDDALVANGHRVFRTEFGSISEPLKDLQRELTHRRPVCLRLDWNGNGHFVAITGATPEPQQDVQLELQEPYGGQRLYLDADQLFGPRLDYEVWASITDVYWLVKGGSGCLG